MKYHTYLEGGPFQGAIWSFAEKEAPLQLNVAAEEYIVLETVEVSVYALKEVSEMEWIRSASFAAYQFVGKKEVNVALVDAWFTEEGMKYEQR